MSIQKGKIYSLRSGVERWNAMVAWTGMEWNGIEGGVVQRY